MDITRLQRLTSDTIEFLRLVEAKYDIVLDDVVRENVAQILVTIVREAGVRRV